MKIYSEEEWFEKFYPKSWGDWRTEFNIEMYRKHQNVTSCSWMNYKLTGWLTSEVNGKMKVNKYSSKPYCLDNFFVECGQESNEDEVCWFIQPYLQQKDKTYYAQISTHKMESNLDIYVIYISGCDDASYTKHVIGMYNLIQEVLYIKNNGIRDIQNREYFFTN
jgi:hypothetical protein